MSRTDFHIAFAEESAHISSRAQDAIREFTSSKKSAFDRNRSRLAKARIYTELLDGEIRILELDAGDLSSPLTGRLHIANVDFAYENYEHVVPTNRAFGPTFGPTDHAVSIALEKPVSYTALSYVWGAPILDQTITLDSGPINITSGLATAMRYLRSTERNVSLWIDQICINQNSKSDKERQIPLMRFIYGHSTNTLIWMENPEGNADLAFKLLDRISSRFRFSELKIQPDHLDGVHLPFADDLSWLAVRQFFGNPWFTRTWVVQECVLTGSNRLFIKYGSAVACWEEIAQSCEYFGDNEKLERLLGSDSLGETCSDKLVRPGVAVGCDIIKSLSRDRYSHASMSAKDPLLVTLVRTRYARATDLRDKVYGVLALSESDLVPDYSHASTAKSVYHQAMLSQLPIRLYMVLYSVDHEIPTRPSWVPDWSVPRVTESLGYSTKVRKLYRAGCGEVAFPKYEVRLNDDKTVLTLKGKVLDYITTLSRPCVSPSLDINNPKIRNKDLEEYWKLVNALPSQHYVVSSISVFDAFWQTLLSGRDGSGCAGPSQKHEDVFSLILDETTGRKPSLPGQTYSVRREKGRFTLDNLRLREPARTLEDLRQAYSTAVKMRKFAITGRGYFGLVPRGTQAGDRIVVFDEAPVPLVARKVDDSTVTQDAYELIGEAYVHGIMQGEVRDMEHIKLQDLSIV